jgi:double-stranded uracil-DNA glycosylase
MRKQGLPPVINDDIRVLILGSMPGQISLDKKEYYANRGNDFWKLVGQVVDNQLDSMEYDGKIACLKKHGIGLWDVYKHCERDGSLDSNIKNSDINDFTILKGLNDLKLICFNGKEAGKSEICFRMMGYNTHVLPSSSGANRKNKEQRIAEWKNIVTKHVKY